MGQIFLFSLVAAANATLLAAVTIMLFLPNPKRLLLGYLAGAMLTSLSIGFVIVFALDDPGSTSTAQHSLAPSMDVTLGLLFLLVAYVLRGGHDERLRARRAAKKGPPEEEKPSKVEQLLGRGSARITFALGVVLTLPGVSYLAALHDLDNLDYGTVPTILVVVGFNLMLLILLEVPLVGYFVAPERTVVEVQRFRAWLTRSGRRIAVYAFAGLGALLVVRGVIGFVS
jgi:hypothetical protein